MAVPATTGKLCTTIEEMKIGDYIRWHHDGISHVMNNNTGNKSEIPFEGQANNISGLDMYWYGVKVSKGLIISDRVIRHSWSWDKINNSRLIEPRFETISGINGIIRSLSGGVAYADVNGSMSLTDKGYGGWPTNNEWDKYIVNFPSNKIQSGKSLDDIFHIRRSSASPYTWCQETPVNGLTSNLGAGTANNTYRIMRGLIDTHSETATVSFSPSSINDSIRGFRPVFEYKEV